MGLNPNSLDSLSAIDAVQSLRSGTRQSKMTGGRFHALDLMLDSLASRGPRLAGWLMLLAQALMNNEVMGLRSLVNLMGSTSLCTSISG